MIKQSDDELLPFPTEFARIVDGIEKCAEREVPQRDYNDKAEIIFRTASGLCMVKERYQSS